MSVPVYLLLLPAAVWLLAAVFGLLDRSDPVATLRAIAWRGLPFLGAALVLGSGVGAPALAALATALLAHVAWTFGVHGIVRRGWLRRDEEL